MMTSREIVQRTINYDSPERVARSFQDSDFRGAGCSAVTHATEWRKVGNGRWERTDEWGNTWGRVDPTSKGEVLKGVLEDISDIDRYAFPDYSRQEDYVGVGQRRAKNPDKWLNGGIPGFAFNIARKMRKLDHYLMDLVLEPDRMHQLHNHILVSRRHSKDVAATRRGRHSGQGQGDAGQTLARARRIHCRVLR